jgi:hypothetical protein
MVGRAEQHRRLADERIHKAERLKKANKTRKPKRKRR